MKGTIWKLAIWQGDFGAIDESEQVGEDILFFDTKSKMDEYIKREKSIFQKRLEEDKELCAEFDSPQFDTQKCEYDSKADLCWALSTVGRQLPDHHEYYKYMREKYRNKLERKQARLQKEKTLAEESLSLSHKEIYMKLVKKFHPDKAVRKNQVDRFTRITKEVNRYNDLQATSKLRKIYIEEM
jgi:hypothetical protein